MGCENCMQKACKLICKSVLWFCMGFPGPRHKSGMAHSLRLSQALARG